MHQEVQQPSCTRLWSWPTLRRVMHNRSDQKVGQVAQRSPQLVVEPLPASVGRHLDRQAGQKTTQRLGPVALQGQEVLELFYDPFY
jgi:hypothetical protein